MKFSQPLTIRLKNGQTITQDSFNLILTDDSHSKRVIAQLLPVTKPFILWEDNTYDTIGDYTQLQAENRLKQILGNDPASKLTTPEPKPFVVNPISNHK